MAACATGLPVQSCHSLWLRDRRLSLCSASFLFNSSFHGSRRSLISRCDEDAVGGSAVLELEASLDRAGRTNGTWFSVLVVHEWNEALVVSHVDDPFICAKPATLEKFWLQSTKLVVSKRREALNPAYSCGVLGIRVPKCARSWT